MIRDRRGGGMGMALRNRRARAADWRWPPSAYLRITRRMKPWSRRPAAKFHRQRACAQPVRGHEGTRRLKAAFTRTASGRAAGQDPGSCSAGLEVRRKPILRSPAVSGHPQEIARTPSRPGRRGRCGPRRVMRAGPTALWHETALQPTRLPTRSGARHAGRTPIQIAARRDERDAARRLEKHAEDVIGAIPGG